jgi:hypothetical protein
MPAQFRRFPGCGLRLFGILWLASLSTSAHGLSISPAPISNGNYVVSWSTTLGCTIEDIYPYYPEHCYSLQENGVDIADSGYSKSVTGKPVGSYEYRVYYRMFVYGGLYDEYTVEGPASVTVGTPPPRDPIPTQLNYQYQTRAGDIDGDGRTDLFVKRTSGGVAGNGVLDSVILRQNPGGTFSLIVPSASQSSIASAWPLSSATTAIKDFNVDGYVDVEVKGVAAATGGAANQIIYSPGAPLQLQPLGLRAFDASLQVFERDMLDYAVDPNYFSTYANVRYFSDYEYYFNCSYSSVGLWSGVWDGGYWLPGCTAGYGGIEGYYVDYSLFSSAALDVWIHDLAFQSGSETASQSTEGAQEAAESVFQVQIGGWPVEEVLGSTGEHTDPDTRRGLETFWGILGIATANADEITTVKAPPQSPRLPNKIYLTGRIIAGGNSRHAALEYTGYSGSPSWYTLSAYNPNAQVSHPTPAQLRYGTLTKQPNWGSDLPMLTFQFGVITPPGQTTNDNYWTLAIAAFSNYRNDLPYDAIGATGFNSNGFIHGLLNVTGGVSSCPVDAAHGFVAGDIVVPPSEFQ